MAADLEFFFDPVCPWAWITSRWVVEVQQQRDYEVVWRPISLWIVNEDRVADWYTPEYRAGHLTGHQVLRVADAVRLQDGNEAVGRLYTTVGEAFHLGRRRGEMTTGPASFMKEMLAAAGLDPVLADHVHDESHDTVIRAETEVAFTRTGRDVGTPIITFHPGTEREGSFFGPVISRIPRGEEAARLWDAIEIVATTSGVSELKRSARGRPDFS
jgi:Mycothiol-dependent nitroreductase Rv2466c